jgi:hypothetical protein
MSTRVIIGDCREVLAYCAGVVDSDGTIGIRRLTYSMRIKKDSKQPTYSARICVRQVTDEAVRLLAVTLGGTVTISKPSLANGRPLFQWEVKDAIAESALNALLPFLRIKRAQAENCLALRRLVAQSKVQRVAIGRGHAGSAPRSTEMTESMELAYLRAKELNAVGARERRLPCPSGS